jgi:tRNA (guanine-N7-)-methyltransferase
VGCPQRGIGEKDDTVGPFFDLKEVLPPESRDQSILYFERIFGNRNPVIVEIGSGNGHFLVDFAIQRPHYNFVGTEILYGRASKFASKVQKRGLKNIIVFWGDTRRFVWEFLYENSVEEFIVLFPDPWPKKRHHKHRMLSVRFIEMLYLRLVTGGVVSVATDYAEYRDFIIGEFSKVSGFRNTFLAGYSDYPDDYPKTLFEYRFREQGKKLFYMEWKKEGAGA